MVFVHGWGGSARYWEQTAQFLATHFDCLLYDLRGFGRSPQHNPDSAFTYTLDDYAEDLLALLDGLELERVWLMGHSLGASIATVFASRYPERVERLLLTCSGIFAYNPLTFKAFHWAGAQVVRLRFDWMQQVPLAEHLFMARFLYRPLPSAMSKPFLEDYLMAQGAAATATIRTAVSEQAAIEMPGHFANLQMPTLLIAGQADQIIPPRLGRAAACLNLYIDYQEIPRTGHFPMLEAPLAYQQVLATFCGFPSIKPSTVL
ncbi:MAG: alpha/beta hydrolase [Spirulina sp. SIO3F2]|nr:alpha/beta hydrolase [Spirulina sp. SIO3F2]